MRNMFLELRSCVLKYEFEGGQIVALSSQSPRPYFSLFIGSSAFVYALSLSSLSSVDFQTLMHMDQNNSFQISVTSFLGLLFSSV